MDIAAEVSLQTLIQTLGLTIRLRMIGCTTTQFDIGQLEELCLDTASENTVTV